jgi:hypothetical protein
LGCHQAKLTQLYYVVSGDSLLLKGDIMQNFPLSRSQNIVVQDINHELLIYDLDINKVYCLNETSAAIWRECDGNSDTEEICRRASFKLKQTVDKDLLRLAIRQFKQENLLENSSEISEFDNISRREIIRRVGLASAIAVPMVSSLIAPRAAMAASVCNPGGNSPNTLKGLCQAGIGQPPATLAGCTATCQSAYGSQCSSCTAFAMPSPNVSEAFECRCV